MLHFKLDSYRIKHCRLFASGPPAILQITDFATEDTA